MRFLIDMNLSPKWASFFESHGIAATHWSQIGPATAADIEIMQYAAEHDWHVLTNDLDFGSILAVTHGQRPSVIQIRSDDLRPSIIGDRVVTALRISASDLHSGALLTIDPGRVRIRLLPLGP